MSIERGPEPDYRTLFESAPGLYLVLEPDLTIVAVTSSYLRATMTVRDEIIGANLFDVFAPNPDGDSPDGPLNLRASIERVRRSGAADAMPVQQYDIIRPAHQGGGYERRYWSSVNSPIFAADGSLRYFLHRTEDVTDFMIRPEGADHEQQADAERRAQSDAMTAQMNARTRQAAAASRELKQTNAELAEMYEKTKELSQAKSQFFAAVSHELRTPLSLVLAPIEQLLSDLPSDDHRYADLQLVRRNALVLLGHVNDLLDVTELDTGSIRLDYAEVDLGDLIRLVGAFFESQAITRGVTLSITAALHLPVEIDQEQLKRVLTNLVVHAFARTPTGGRIRLELRRDGTRAIVEIADSGAPIAAADRELVFEPFRQNQSSTRGGAGDTGLALSIARDLVTLHGGSCTVDDAPEGGARFTVSLPLRAPAGTIVREADPIVIDQQDMRVAPPGEPITAADEEDDDDTSRPIVLVVEDNPELNQLICDTLGANYRTISAYDGGAGLAAARSELPDLIVCDIMMPEMSGDELVAAIRSDADLTTTPILILSARADDHARLDLLRAGVNDYLVKPFAIGELRARVNNLVSVRQAESRLRALRMTGERDRIARDLHDVVIQRLFAIGMRLDSVLRYDPTEVVRQRISETVEELDNVIRDIRSTIFDLQRPLDAAESLRSQVMALCAAAGEQAGCTPRVGFDGPVDVLVDGAVAQQLIAVLQEALSNVVRHAYASMIDVVVATSPDAVVLTVRDDGVGPNDEASAGNGLRNMASRAQMLGGGFVVVPNEPIGTMVRWTVPLTLSR